MYVIKRNGVKQLRDLTQIRKQTSAACDGLENVTYEELEESVMLLIRDEMPTTEVQEILIQSALNKIDVDRPAYTYVGARLALYDLYHRIKRIYNVPGSGDVYNVVSFSDYLLKNKPILTDFHTKYTSHDITYLNNFIDSDRDKLFNYMGFVTMRDRYLAKLPDHDRVGSTEQNVDGVASEVTELPQHMHMAIAVFLMQNENKNMRNQHVIELYEATSKLEYINSTPVNTNARLISGGLISCLLGTVPDTIDGIFDLAKEVAIGSKIGAGWGIDWSRVRSVGSSIGIVKNAAGGKVPFIKIFNDISVAVDQNGKRPGAFAFYIETWDIEIFDFLSLKKKNGDERKRAREIFLAVSASDLYMERDEANADWTLFDPADVSDLTELFGDEFRTRYEWYEKDFLLNPSKYNPNTRVVNIKDIAREIAISYNNEGQPFWFFKDTVNQRHKHKQLGIIRSSNLCTEVLQPASDTRTAVCNLGSINLARVNTQEDLIRVTRIAVRALDNSVDLTKYPSDKARLAQQERRSIGIGMLGEAEMIANKGIHYGSDEHNKLISEIYKTVREAAEEMSRELAIEKGSCIIDGMRNAYLMATAPNSTSGLFAGTTNSHEAVYNKSWVEENKLGSFVMTAPNINIHNYEYYRNPYEIDIYKQIDTCAIRQKEVDMGISFNIYLHPDNLKASDIRNVIRYAWKKKLLTTYYLRSKPPKVNEVKNEIIACVGCAN